MAIPNLLAAAVKEQAPQGLQLSSAMVSASGVTATATATAGAGGAMVMTSLFSGLAVLGLSSLWAFNAFNNPPASQTLDLSTQSAPVITETQNLPSILDRTLDLHIINGNISEVAREIYRRMGPEFRWAYPAEGVFLSEFVSIDTRGEPQSLNSILDSITEQAGLEWQLYNNRVVFVVPLTAEETAAQQRIWNDPQVEMKERIRAARTLAHNLDTEAMTWLFQQFGGKVIPDEVKNSQLRFVGRRLRFPFTRNGSWATTFGLSSPYILVGDRPEVVDAVKEMLEQDQIWYFHGHRRQCYPVR